MSTTRMHRCTASVLLLILCCAEPVRAADDLDGLVFEQLGPAACEIPPADVTPESFEAMAAASPPMAAGAARGQVTGAFDAGMVGTAVFGRDEAGGLAVAVQGIFRSAESGVLTACVALLRLSYSNGGGGAPMPLQADVTGEAGMDVAAPGSFLAVVRFLGRDADGTVRQVGSGDVTGGSLSLSEASAEVREAVGAPPGIEVLAGTLRLSSGFRRRGAAAAQPLQIELSFPVAPHFLQTVPRLTTAVP